MRNKLILAGISIFAGWLWGKRQSSQPQSIKNAVTIITGGASGIGKATAHIFAKQGAVIIIADLEHQLTNTLKQEFEPYNTPIHFIACDITQADHRHKLIGEVMSNYAHIDILINNAGISRGGAFVEQSSEAIDQVININLLGTIHLTHAVLHIMKEQNQGHIVNVSSVGALMPPQGEAIYAAAKGGLNAFSDSLRRELSKTNIHISVVMPALTQTEMLNDVNKDELRDGQVIMAGTGLDTPQNVAEAILSAVQFNRREVICGGQSTELLSRLAQLRPSAMDWAFKHVINTDKFMETLKKVGVSDESE